MCIFKFSKKHHLVCFLSLLNYGDIGSVLIKHLQIVIPLSYPCHYTNFVPVNHKNQYTHTHTPHTHTHTTPCVVNRRTRTNNNNMTRWWSKHRTRSENLCHDCRMTLWNNVSYFTAATWYDTFTGWIWLCYFYNIIYWWWFKNQVLWSSNLNISDWLIKWINYKNKFNKTTPGRVAKF